MDFDISPEDILPAIILPQSITSLIVSGAWRDIGLLGSWSLSRANLFQDWPPQGWLEANLYKHVRSTSLWGDIPSEYLLQPATFHNVAEQLRLIASDKIMEGDTLDTLSTIIKWLDDCETSAMDLSSENLEAHAHRWDRASLLALFRASRMLSQKTRDGMQVFLQQSLKGILPTAFHATVKKAISRSKLPSKEALRECQVSVDAAYMLHARRFHSATGTAKYMWWDATAHKHDFLLSQVHEVQSDKMCAAMSLLHNLLQHHDRASGKDDSFRRNGRSLNDMIRVHTFPPVVLGLRCSSLEHKVGAFVHALTLEMGGLQGLQQWLSELVSVTSDMGTELGMAEFNMLELAHILPPWMMLQPIQDDAGLPANLTKEKQRQTKNNK